MYRACLPTATFTVAVGTSTLGLASRIDWDATSQLYAVQLNQS